MPAKLYESEKWLKRQLHTLRRSPEDIGKELGVSHMTIRRWAKKHNLMK